MNLIKLQSGSKRGSIFVCILLLISTFTINLKAQVVVNQNGDFESSDVTVGTDTAGVDSWTFELQDAGDADFIIVDDEVQSGNRALAIVVHTAGANAWHIQAINEEFEVVPGRSYNYSVWLKSSSSGTSVDITAGNPDFEEFGRQSVTVGTEWSEFNFNFTVPANDTTVGRAPIHFSNASNVGDTIWVDNLQVTHPNVYPLIFEAESGIAGAEWDTVTTDDGITYLTTTTDFNETTGGGDHPGENRTISYEITFSDTGSYDLFARIRMPAGDAFNDDSFYLPYEFGEKDPENPDDWYLVNGLATGGFSGEDEVVRGAGGLGGGEWKWVNLSRSTFQSDTAFAWSIQDSLTRAFQIGAREDGLEIDKFAFGPSHLYFTVGNLNNGTSGFVEDPSDIAEPMDPIAHGKDKFLGNIYSPSQTDGFEYHWNQVTPENAGKWGSVEGTRDQMNWGGLDAAYNLAKDNGFPFRFHVLVWGSQQPGWLAALSEDEQLEEIEEWFQAVADRYDDIDYLEVVNEPLHAPAGYKNALGGDGETGWDWIITAFEMARDIFPASTKLMLNDYNVLGSQTSAYMKIVDLLVERELIDAIGAQGHHFTMRNITPNQLQSRLDTFAERGLPIQVTEYDVEGNPNVNDNDPVDERYPQEQSDAIQLETFKRTFPVIWEHPAVEGVTLWGWRLGGWRPAREMHLVHNNGEARPAFGWLRNYVETGVVSNERVADSQPKGFKLYNNYPNPFNPTTQIKYDVATASEVNIKVYDLTGRLIQTLVNNQQNPGSYSVSFDASALSTGVYFYRIQAGSFVDVKQMMLIK